MTQDTYSVTYDPGFLSFLPTKDTEMKLSSQTHHNIIQQNLSTTLNLVALTDSCHFFPKSTNMTTQNQTTLASPIQHTNAINFKILIIKHGSYWATLGCFLMMSSAIHKQNKCVTLLPAW